MKKKILLVLALAALTAIPAFAAATGDNQTDNQMFNQMFNRHQQMVQQAVKDGRITADEAATMDEHMKEMAPIMGKMMQNGCPMGNTKDKQ